MADDALRDEQAGVLRTYGDNVTDCLLPALRLPDARQAAGLDAVAWDCAERRKPGEGRDRPGLAEVGMGRRIGVNESTPHKDQVGGSASRALLHALITVHSRRCGGPPAMRLPQVEPLLEVPEGHTMWCPAPGTYGGFALRWTTTPFTPRAGAASTNAPASGTASPRTESSSSRTESC